MTQLADPNIEVIISPELRALYASASDPAIANAPRFSNAAVRKRAAASVLGGPQPMWRPISLRRDGQRPFRFEGLCVASYAVPLRSAVEGFTHKLSLYVSQANDFYLSLAVLPPANVALRPIFDAVLLKGTAMSRLQADWNERVETVLSFVTPSSHPTDSSSQSLISLWTITPFRATA